MAKLTLLRGGETRQLPPLINSTDMGHARLRRSFLFLKGWLRGLCPWRARRKPH